jgi:hypothetical protein
MIEIKGRYGAEYSAPECFEVEIVTEGAMLSVSMGSAEGYDVDKEDFNW